MTNMTTATAGLLTVGDWAQQRRLAEYHWQIGFLLGQPAGVITG